MIKVLYLEEYFFTLGWKLFYTLMKHWEKSKKQTKLPNSIVNSMKEVNVYRVSKNTLDSMSKAAYLCIE